MRAPVLKIRKKVLNLKGQDRPCVQVLADVDSNAKAALEQYFLEVNLFKRTMFSNGCPKELPQPEPELMPHLMAFVRDDACPEISVKTLLGGQLYQAKGPWDLMSFEYIAKRSFDSLMVLLACIGEMGREVEYAPVGTDPIDMTFIGSEEKPADVLAPPSDDAGASSEAVEEAA
jgi:hypothetical protein